MMLASMSAASTAAVRLVRQTATNNSIRALAVSSNSRVSITRKGRGKSLNEAPASVDDNVLTLPNGRYGFRPMANSFISFELGNYHDEEEGGDWEEFVAGDDDDNLKVHPIYSYDENEKISDLTAAIREYEIEKKKFNDEKEAEMEEIVRVQELDARGRAYGRGSRKTAQARVWIFPGEGNITINRKDLVDYFDRESNRELLLMPFVATGTCGMFDVKCYVQGGGLSGQAGAIRHGLARALEKYNPDFRPPLKALGFLTRDPRMVERKKYGLKKARKAPQWVKR
mmetsp:Transcript_13497/g.20547  ORF Transcript_13497/g.20547 Transcript_13497/m.20547 type:complete len:284 (+) Transcript_13497:49-900(+)